jgi:hypothetical protein
MVLCCDAPDETLDRRLTKRGEELPPERFRLRNHYRDETATNYSWRRVLTTEGESYALDAALFYTFPTRREWGDE